MSMFTTLFSRIPMFIYGGVTVYGYQRYVRDEQIFKNGFRCGINELLGDDSVAYQKHATEAEFNTHYQSYLNHNLKN